METGAEGSMTCTRPCPGPSGREAEQQARPPPHRTGPDPSPGACGVQGWSLPMPRTPAEALAQALGNT